MLILLSSVLVGLPPKRLRQEISAPSDTQWDTSPPLQLDLPNPKHDIEVFHSQKFTYQDKTLYIYRAK
jgi:hypothetical protein